MVSPNASNSGHDAHSLLYIRPITGVGIRGSTYALLLLIHQINEHRQRRRRCNDCRIQITIGKICPTSTGVRDNVVIVPLANSRKRKTRCGFSSLFRSCEPSFDLVQSSFPWFFYFLFLFFAPFKRKQRSFHQFHRFICPPVVSHNIYDLWSPRKYILLGYLRFHCIWNNHLFFFFFLFLPEKDRNIDGNHWYVGTLMRIFIK